jgi:cbb3-type cytochrome oxidase subunit 3
MVKNSVVRSFVFWGTVAVCTGIYLGIFFSILRAGVISWQVDAIGTAVALGFTYGILIFAYKKKEV